MLRSRVSSRFFFFVFLTIVSFFALFPKVFSEDKAAADYIIIDLNPSIRFQTILGWEGTAQIGNNSAAFPKVKDKIIDLAVNDLGLNRIRIGFGARNENKIPGLAGKEEMKGVKLLQNDNRDAHKINWNGFQFDGFDARVEDIAIPFRKALGAKGESLYLTVCYVNFDHTYLHRDNPEEYAELMQAVFLHMKEKFGFVPDAVEMILEPDNSGWTGRDIGKAMVATAKRLKAEGFSPDFIAPSTTDMSKASTYFDDMMKVKGVSEIMTEFSYHRYRGVSEAALQAIASRAAKYHLRTSMLEFIGASSAELHQDLKVGQVSAWQQYTIAFPGVQDPGGAYFRIDDRDPKNPTVYPARNTGLLRQYFRYIRRNAVRIEATSNDPRFDPLAFINSNGKYVVVIQSPSAGIIGVKGLPPGDYAMSFATRKQKPITEQPVEYGDPLFVRSDGSGVLTLFGK